MTNKESLNLVLGKKAKLTAIHLDAESLFTAKTLI